MAPDPDRRAGPGATRFITGDAVQLDIRVARLGSRVLARLIDLTAQVVIFFALLIGGSLMLALLSAVGGATLDNGLFTGLMITTIAIVLVGYPVAMETLTRGRTLGKMAVGLRVVRDDGGPVAFRQALTRALVGTAVEWPGLVGAPLTWLACLWTMLANRQSKRLGDYTAGTVVIHERTPAAWGWVPVMPAGLAGWASTLDLAGLDDDLALAVRHFLARNRQLREPARTQLGYSLARDVASVTNPPPPPGTPGWAYLAAVHAERHRRAMHRLATVRSRAATVWPALTGASAEPAGAPPGSPAADGGLPQVRPGRPAPASPAGVPPS